MNLLVTAGNTQTPIDKVRCLTNIFTGRTGTRIAVTAHQRGHGVTLLTSHPELAREMAGTGKADLARWQVLAYRTFDELHQLLRDQVSSGGFDAIVHAAAVSDYRLGGAYAPAQGSRFDVASGMWLSPAGEPQLVDVGRGKLKGSHDELWLRLVPTVKLVDQMRQPWGFGGLLVKFKLEVDVSEEELQALAENARMQSKADLLVANTLEGMHEWALLGPLDGGYEKVPRGKLDIRLLEEVERRAGATPRSSP